VVANLPYVGFIPVRDLDAAEAFYCGVLGLPVTGRDQFALVVDAGGTTVRLFPIEDPGPRHGTVAGWSVDDIGASVRDLAARGVEFARYEGMEQDGDGIWNAPGGGRVAWFADPDGNTLSLTEPPTRG